MLTKYAKWLVIALIVSFVAASYWWVDNIIGENDNLRQQLDLKNAVIERKDTELSNLANELGELESINTKLLSERQALAELQERYRSKSRALENELTSARNQINQLRHSDDITVNQWANTRLPADAVRVLKLSF